MAEQKVDVLIFNQLFGDCGVEYSVSYDRAKCSFVIEADTMWVGICIDDLDWLIRCLQRIKSEL